MLILMIKCSVRRRSEELVHTVVVVGWLVLPVVAVLNYLPRSMEAFTPVQIQTILGN